MRAAGLAGGCHLFTKWIPGTITNGQQILGKARKRVVDHLDEEVGGFEDQVLLAKAVKPDLVVCLNLLENYVLLRECAMEGIPTVGVVDTDCNPTWVTYPVPANDDSLRCIQVIAGVLGRAGEEGQAERKRRALVGRMPARQDHGLEAPVQKEDVEGQAKVERRKTQAVGMYGAEAAAGGEEVVIPEFDDQDVANLAALEQGGEEVRAAEGADGTFMNGLEQERGEDVPYERDAAIEGGADSTKSAPAEFEPVTEQKTESKDAGKWA